MEEKLACNYMSYLLNSTTPKSNKHIYILKPDSYILILERLFAKNKNRKQYVTFKSQTTSLVFFLFFLFTRSFIFLGIGGNLLSSSLLNHLFV